MSHVSTTTRPSPLRLPSVSIPESLHDDAHVLVWQAHGSSTAVLDGNRKILLEGYALWIPAGMRHFVRVDSNSVTLPMLFRTSDVETNLLTPSVTMVDRDMQILFLAYIQYETTSLRDSVNVGRQILALLERRLSFESRLPRPVSDPALTIAERLQGDPGDPRTAEELARSVHTSLRTLEREFLRETGMTLRQWRLELRMEAACRMLDSGVSIDAVANRVGYGSIGAFRRTFKARIGLTPSAYAQHSQTRA